jgi:hypothetical protein
MGAKLGQTPGAAPTIKPKELSKIAIGKEHAMTTYLVKKMTDKYIQLLFFIQQEDE